MPIATIFSNAPSYLRLKN